MADVLSVLPKFTPHMARLALPADADPAYRYRWASMDTGRVDFLKSVGYEIVYTKDSSGQDAARVADNSILMRCPREQWDRRQGFRQNRAQELAAAPRKALINTGAQMGVEVKDQTREYRAPMSAVLNEPADSVGSAEGVVTREQVGMAPPANAFNPHLKE